MRNGALLCRWQIMPVRYANHIL
uniref:U1740x n=1 Tax=Mycobacterium leprae TaxID=1769 RepID=Q50082_MYCLR|nr:u1740x [Mycobacterium leprae]